MVGLGTIVVLGVGMQWLARRLRLPAILLLLASGLIVGPWLEDRTPLKLAELIEREFGGFIPPKMFDD